VNGLVHMAPPGVSSAGSAAAKTADDARQDLKNCLDPSADAAAANPGWASAKALTGCATAWSRHLTDLINRTSHLAESLHVAAKVYADADQQAAGVLHEFRAG
jgi:uncharacterized protein YukE